MRSSARASGHSDAKDLSRLVASKDRQLCSSLSRLADAQGGNKAVGRWPSLTGPLVAADGIQPLL